MKAKSVFEFNEYKKYLISALEQKDAGGRGARSALAAATHCQMAYVSQVLNGNAHFSLEQADLINEFLSHGREESDFFMLLLLKDRAGTVRLKGYLQNHIEKLLARRSKLSNQLAQKIVSKEAQTVYYSQWYYSAIHILLAIPQFQTRDAIVKQLKIAKSTVTEVLDYLVREGLAKRSGDRFEPGLAKVLLKKESSMFAVNHANWRHMAVRSIDAKRPTDRHFTAVIAISSEDAKKLGVIIRDFIDQTIGVVLPSKEEELHCLCLDYFKVEQ